VSSGVLNAAILTYCIWLSDIGFLWHVSAVFMHNLLIIVLFV